ncbi:MAG: abhydrolase domain-containing 18 [Acidobacteriota bacterium]
MIGRAVFHAWERRLAEVSRHERVVRPFEWGLDWLPENGHASGAPALDRLREWVADVMADTDAFFTPAPTRDYRFAPAPADRRARGEAGTLTFPSGLTTPHAANNTVSARYFPADPLKPFARRTAAGPRRAVVVLAQWNSDAEGHVGLCRLLARLGVSALRISLPYHDVRMPPELTRADYIVSSNVARTLQVCRQAVMDVRLALWWLRDQGYERLGVLGTSLGSCLAMLTGCHEPLVRAMALNHVSPFFADVVWRGLSTEHVRKGLEPHVSLDLLRELWRPIAPWSYLDRARDKHTLLVYARYDLTFPLDLSRLLIDEFRRRRYPVEVAMLPCGHYSTGEAPFKYLDGYYLGKFLATRL